MTATEKMGMSIAQIPVQQSRDREGAVAATRTRPSIPRNRFLTGAALSGATLRGAALRGATLSGATLIQLPLPHPRSQAFHRSLRLPTGPRKPAFSLIELLVVVAIVALLLAILLPSLAKAREQARLVTCQSNLHQIGTAVVTYAAESRGRIPFGPNVAALGPMLSANDGTMATNQIWTGPQPPATSFMALGLLMNRSLAFPELMYCPADDSTDPVEELAKIRARQPSPGYCSYLYRQLDETDGRGRIDDLGRNSTGGRARALALDMNSVVTAFPEWQRTNHRARRVNVLYLDASALSFSNEKHPFSLRDQDLMDMPARLDEILQAADRGYQGGTP